MTTYDVTSSHAHRPTRALGSGAGRSALQALARAFAGLAHRREERRTVAALSRLDPRRLEDMGLDPDAIYDAVEGTWNERPVHPRFPKL